MPTKRIAIVGAGPAGLMAAEVLSQWDYEIHVFEQKPSAARKFLMAGKTGLNISHAEPLAQFVQRYDAVEWLKPWLENCDATWIQAWMHDLGISSYIGSSGRVFPVEMKAAPLLRAWLRRLVEAKVQFHYRHQVLDLKAQQLTVQQLNSDAAQAQQLEFDAIILACGAVSWPQLGSDGAWQQWLSATEIDPFQASNVGVLRTWSSYMQPLFGQPLKRVAAWVETQDRINEQSIGDIVISHYGLESGLIYKQGRALRQQRAEQATMSLYLDLLPELSEAQLTQKLRPQAKQSTANLWRKAGLDQTKAALLRELVDKALWNNPAAMAQQIKQLKVELSGFRPIEEAISCAGGVRQQALSDKLQLKSNPQWFCCGEMLDWDAPTGGYLLTACFATGRAAAEGAHHYLGTLSTHDFDRVI
ncbi:hypothetical protein EC844_101169 [Acinetobacter calcoaceticus]|uniref:Flavoprotein n=1 Tax=Acinetobacter calcoaceticus TaxID=471 RepID=A0A4R1Y701_ACICA|nr:hypothetical protein EC844_101169 [Acinetobacter calcoaceticus]